MKEQMRAEFEAWLVGFRSNAALRRFENGEYVSAITENYFSAWQAALSAVPANHIGDSNEMAQQPAQEPTCPQCGVRSGNGHCLGDIWNCSDMPTQEPVKQEPYAYDVPTEDGTELAYAIYFTKYGRPLPEDAIPLYLEAQP